jgi:3-hydroxyisobutyrate dehydrogenase-like beta-hydroxyacid dehydrogenase
MKVGFIGTGNMGRNMVKNLLLGGHEVIVYDIVPEAAKSSLAAGAVWADSPSAVASQCRVVMASLPGPADVELVVMAPNGILATAKKGDIFVDLSTNSLSMVQHLYEVAAQKGVAFLDAPVSGGTVGAEKGTLAIMIGGDEKAFEAVRDPLSSIGKHLFFLGRIGCGTITKLMNNMIGLTATAVVAEAMVLGVKAGMDARKMWEVIMASTGRCVALENLPQTILAGNFDPGFMVDLGTKDMNLAINLGREMKVPVPVASAALQRYVEAQARGLGREACPAIVKLSEGLAGVEVRDQ